MPDELEMGDKVKAPLDVYKLANLLARYTQYAILTLSYRYCVDYLQRLSDR
ncbi:hypothetical protein H1Q63_01085 [Desmonostoc muscorum CCALA 125]|nr:hypothetical protein [Desmonostoc muscorum CCALA 125]